MEAYVGQIILFAGPRDIEGWMECDGQMLSTNDYPTLFALLGTAFGGNGTTTFALPDLRGRVPIGVSVGPSPTPRKLGSTGGAETVTLQLTEMAAHTHQAFATSAPATTNVPASNVVLAATPTGAIPNGTVFYFNPPSAAPPAPAAMGTGTIGQTAVGGQAHNNIMPYMALRYLISVGGIFPSP